MSASATQKPPKRALKEAVKALLTEKTPAGARVFLSRGIPTQTEEMPLVLIYTPSESAEVFDVSQKRYKRVLDLRIECITQGVDDDDLDRRLETLGELVEELMERDETLGGIASTVEFLGAEYQVEHVSDSPTGLLALRYGIEFYTYAQRLDGQCLDDFNLADINWKVGHHAEPADNIVDAHDSLPIP